MVLRRRIHVYKTHKLSFYDTPYNTLTRLSSIPVSSMFPNHTPSQLLLLFPSFTNNIFNQYEYIHNFPLSNTLVFTNTSVSSSTSGYAYVILELCIQSYGNLSAYVLSFTTECTTILKALICISYLTSGNYLVISDFQASLLALTRNPFYSKCSPIILKIRSSLLSLNSKFFPISFLWILRPIGILGNEKADSLTRSTRNICPSSFPLYPYSELIPIHQKLIN